MKTRKNFLQIVLTLIIVLTRLNSSIAQIGKETLPDMDASVFKSYMNSKLNGNVKGYAFYLTKAGNYVTSDAKGVARTAEDNNGKELPYTINTLQEIASVSKTITAIALLRALEKSDVVNVNSKIGPWLPKGWKVSTSFASITFRQLLAHRAGLRGDTTLTGPGYENLIEKYAAKTINPELQKVRSYLNLNYQIIRVVMPNIISQTHRDQDLVWTSQLKQNKITKLEYNALIAEYGSARYRNYVMQYLFKPAGVTTPTCNPIGHTNLAWAYETKNSTKGSPGKDHSEYCSSGFWQVSAKDFAVFMTKAMYSEDIISHSTKLIMNNTFDPVTVGWSHKLKRGNGYNYGHGGDIYWGLPEVHSYVLYMPGNYVAYVHVNSKEFGSSSLKDLLYQAYDAARKFPYNCYNNGATYNFPNASQVGHITKVKLGTLNQASGKSTGYTFYNNYVTSLKQDSTYALTLNSGFVSNQDNVYWSAWIDYNQDGSFNSTERIFAKSSISGKQEQSQIKIPNTALKGITRMRVALKRHDSETIADACSSFTFGEVEDYFIDITRPCGLITNMNTVNITSTGASLTFSKPVDNISNYTIRYEEVGSNVVKTVNAAKSANSTETYVLLNLKPNTSYRWAVRSNCGDYGAFKTFKTQDVNICGTDVNEGNRNSINAKLINLGETKTALICSNTSVADQDWFKFNVSSNTLAGVKIKIDLTSLPADYDLYLYTSNLTLAGTSSTRGTTSEVIEKILTTGTYYIKVIGYEGAEHTHFYYQLSAKKSEGIATLRQAGSAEENTFPEVNIYPNPVSNGILNIDFGTGLPEGIEPQVQLFGTMGNGIATSFTYLNEEGKLNIDTSEIEKGLYTLRVIIGEKVITKKVVVQ